MKQPGRVEEGAAIDRDGALEVIQGAISCEVVALPIVRLRVSDSLRIAGEDARHLNTLAEAEGLLPPIVVHRRTMTVIDGVHRLRLAQRRGASVINAVYFDGDESAAFVFSVRVNSKHGLPLSLTDRKAAAARMLSDYPEWSNRRLAAVAGLSDKTIASIRKRLGAEIPHPTSARVGRDGVSYPTDPRARRRRAEEHLRSNPSASAKEVALAAGISLTTSKEICKNRREIGGSPHPQPVSRVAPEVRSITGGRRTTAEIHKTDRSILVDLGEMVRRLRADPSLRFTEQGRKLLRMLELLAAGPDEWSSISESVPVHCAPIVAELARHQSNSWKLFAECLDLRIIASESRSKESKG